MTLVVKHLTVSLKNRHLITDLSFSLGANQSLSIIGPSGSGKTSLVRAILGLSSRLKIAGRIFFNDQLLQEDDRLALPISQRKFGYVPQDLALWPHLNVIKSVKLAAKFSHAKFCGDLSQLLSDCGLNQLTDQYPSTLSGGERQRLALARALLSRPSLLILDEPFTGLDVVAKSQLLALVHQQKERYRFATIFISHDLAEVLAMGDAVMIMNGGRLHWLGAKTSLRHDCFLPHWNPLTSSLIHAEIPTSI